MSRQKENHSLKIIIHANKKFRIYHLEQQSPSPFVSFSHLPDFYFGCPLIMEQSLH